MALTWVGRQVLEVHRFADLAVRGPAQLHLDSDGLAEVSFGVRRCAEHDGHLPVDVGLGERALPLPGVLEEAHLDVLCRGTEQMGTFKAAVATLATRPQVVIAESENTDAIFTLDFELLR